MAKIQSITKPKTIEQKERPTVALIAQATDKRPLMNPDPRGQLALLADDIRKRTEQLRHVRELMQEEADKQNPIVIGAVYFIDPIIEELEKDAEFLDDTRDMLHVQE